MYERWIYLITNAINHSSVTIQMVYFFHIICDFDFKIQKVYPKDNMP